MNAGRKRALRLGAVLTVAVLLAVALLYTSFNSATDAASPSALLRGADRGKRVQLTGDVVPGSLAQRGQRLRFRVRDSKSPKAGSVPVVYAGSIPDTVHTKRKKLQVLVTGRYRNGVFHGIRDTLTAKCPSKFQATSRVD